MKLLNLGCGPCYNKEWINIDFVAISEDVIAHDLSRGIPFPDDEFDAVYHSHLLEHFDVTTAHVFMRECHRVLRLNGIIRVVVPDLEAIATAYLEQLRNCADNAAGSDANYDWMMLELLDQVVRDHPGGGVAAFLSRPVIPNKDFILSRIGSYEPERFWNPPTTTPKRRSLPETGRQILLRIAKNLVMVTAGRDARRAFDQGLFRKSGEVHLWMYDQYSLGRLLRRSGFTDVRQYKASESMMPGFAAYNLDTLPDGSSRKGDSLFMEGRKV